MNSSGLNIIMRLFVPSLMQSAADKIGSYNTYVLHLPQGTNVGELMYYLVSELPKISKWKLMRDKLDPVVVIKASHDIRVPQNQVLSFKVAKDNLMDSNYAKIVHVLGETDINLGDKLYIFSHFEQAQPVERGKLTAVNDAVIDKVKIYFAPKNFNIDMNITSMEKYQDVISKHDKNINPLVAIFIILLVFGGGAWVLFNLASITAFFM